MRTKDFPVLSTGQMTKDGLSVTSVEGEHCPHLLNVTHYWSTKDCRSHLSALTHFFVYPSYIRENLSRPVRNAICCSGHPQTVSGLRKVSFFLWSVWCSWLALPTSSPPMGDPDTQEALILLVLHMVEDLVSSTGRWGKSCGKTWVEGGRWQESGGAGTAHL